LHNIQTGSQKIDILDFDNFYKNNNIIFFIDPQSFKDLKALCSFIKEVLLFLKHPIVKYLTFIQKLLKMLSFKKNCNKKDGKLH
jgi:hypothetical protein